MIKLLLALLAAGKLGKIALTGGTMILSVLTYSLVYGWRYALGLVLLIFVHESGHWLAARRAGLAVGAPVFIPFVGAWVALKTEELDPQTEAEVALAGPVLGTLGAYLCWLLSLSSPDRLWLALAYGGFFINLFNLIPLRPLDGGRVARIVSPQLWIVGLLALVAVFAWQPSPLLLLIGLAAAPEVWAALQGRQSAAHQAVPARVRLRFGAAYLGLAGGLAVTCHVLHRQLTGAV